MTMLELCERQRAVLIDKLPDVGNVAAGALIFGQALSERGFSRSIALWGFGVWLLMGGFAVVLAGRKEP